MNNFISLLDTTLHLNKEDDKSDEDVTDSKVEEEEEKVASPVSSPDIHRSASLPSESSSITITFVFL